MPGESAIHLDYEETGVLPYATLEAIAAGNSGKLWNTDSEAFETRTVANWTTYHYYDLDLAETPASSYHYVGDMPAVPAGFYLLNFYLRAGAASAISDWRITTIPIYWDGATVKDATTAAAVQTGDSFARLGAPAGASISADIANIATAITLGAPTTHAAMAGEVIAGDEGATTYEATKTDDDDHWEIAVGSGAAGIDARLTFQLGETARASSVAVNGHLEAVGQFVHIDAWDYMDQDWDQLTNDTTRMNNAQNDANYGPFGLLARHQKADNGGEVKIRFRCASTNPAHTLYLDRVVINGVSLGTLTAGTIADAVWVNEVRTLTAAGEVDWTPEQRAAILAALAAIKLKTDSIGNPNVTYSSWVNAAGARRIFAGEDFLAADGRALAFTIRNYTGPDLTDATCRLRLLAAATYDAADSDAAELAADATITVTTEADGTKTVTVAADVASAETARLGSVPTGKTPNYVHQWMATLANGHKAMLLHGRLIVSETIQ